MPSALSFDELNRLSARVSGADPFEATDRVVRRYVRMCVRRFAALRSAATREDDSYRLMLLVWACYADAWDQYAGCLSEAHRRAYGLVLPSGGRRDHAAAFDAYGGSHAAPEGYVPRQEWERKRARALESLVTAKETGGGVGRSVDASRDAWARQLRQGADDMTVRGMADAYSDAGVERVRFVTERDDRVCAGCRALDGRTYRLGEQPAIPVHYHCRCHYEPVA